MGKQTSPVDETLQATKREIKSKVAELIRSLVGMIKDSAERVGVRLPIDSFKDSVPMNLEQFRLHESIIALAMNYDPFLEQIGKERFSLMVLATVIDTVNAAFSTDDLNLDSIIGQHLKILDDQLTVKNLSYRIYFQISSIEIEETDTPTKIGQVWFVRAGEQTIKGFIEEALRHAKNPDKVSDGYIKRIKSFKDQVCCYIDVVALSHRAAHKEGMAKIQYTLDILTYFADFVDNQMQLAPFRLSTGNHREVLRSISLPMDSTEKGVSVTETLVGLSLPRNLRRLIEKMEVMGIRRILGVLEKEERKRNSFERKVLTAIHWVSRGIQKEIIRADEAFLFYIIALESLVSKRRGEVSLQFSLKTTHLVALFPDLGLTPKEAKKRCEDLYDKRSAIVHGRVGGIEEQTLRSAKFYVRAAITALLTHEVFSNMTTEEELEEWFEEKLLGVSNED